jgi:hypothetical protein
VSFITGSWKEKEGEKYMSAANEMGRTKNHGYSYRENFMEWQRRANRWTYLDSGMTHPNFLATLERLAPEARARVEQIAPAFC